MSIIKDVNSVKVAVVGLNRGRILADYILDFVKNMELVAVCDIVKEKADEYAKEKNISNVYYSIDDVIHSDVDAVVLATPIPDHKEHIIKCLLAKKHVLCEVITGLSYEECQQIADAVKEARKHGIKFMMEENYCFYRPLTIVHNMIRAGLFGDIYYGEADYLMDFQLRKGFPDAIEGWRREAYFGVKGHPYITHTLGPLCFLMDSNVDRVSCMTAGNYDTFTADRTCTLMLKTKKGGMIRLRNSFLSARPDLYTYYSLQGTKGCYQGPQGPSDYHKVHIRGLCEPNEWRNVYDFKGFLPKEWSIFPEHYFNDSFDDGTSKYDSGTPLVLGAFANSIIKNIEPPFTAEDAINWSAAGIASDISAKKGGEPVEVPEFF